MLNLSPNLRWDLFHVTEFSVLSSRILLYIIWFVFWHLYLQWIQFEPLPIESKNAATVILMLQSPEEDVLVKALEAIRRFAENGVQVFSHECTSSHLMKVSHADLYVCACVCACVWVSWCSLGDENKSSLMALGAVERLTRLITHDDKTVCRNAFMALGVMVSDSKSIQKWLWEFLH